MNDEVEVCEVPDGSDLPVCYGYLYKKSPGKFRLKLWDWRFFAVCNMKIIWWKNMESCIPEGRARVRADTADIKLAQRRHRPELCSAQGTSQADG
eukprot:CAMPEP_0183397548 /NCGR_PEP_ID=MMETSP0370-20130417/10672_1 /TAXON_ID=268820 /ORGANISM="Peridinium aciculiferum, Strain PAER-2" /LENGTH=94 /DNA_ID=CAMNT_0025578447 /DNA_START=149 /DNA_END=434 /DNA_ORIENTATION=-